MSKTIRAGWRLLCNLYYRIFPDGENEYAFGPKGYCARCNSCGEDGCCPESMCDNGIFCSKFYKKKLPIVYYDVDSKGN